MLKTMRGGVKGIFAWLVVGLFIIAFAFVGVPALNSLGNTDAVKVGDEAFSVTEVEREFIRRVNQQQAQTGEALTRQAAIQQGVLADTVSFFVLKGLFAEEREALGLAVSDEMVQTYTRQREEFLDSAGNFDADLFTQLLSVNGFTLQSYRALAEGDIDQRQISQSVALGVPAPKALTRHLVLRQTEERTVKTATLTLSGEIAPSDDALRSFYAENADRYAMPETRSYDLVVLDRESLKEAITVSPEDVRQLFDARRDRLGTPERRSFVQAQFSTAEAAADAFAAITAGGSLEDVADGAGVAVVSFEDEIKTNLADPKVADAIFAAEAPGVVGPVDSVFGTVIAEVTGISEGTAVTFEDVRADLETELFDEIYRSTVGEIYLELQETGDAGSTLAGAASGLGLDVRAVGPVDRDMVTPGGAIEADVPMAAHRLAFSRPEGSLFEAVDLPETSYGFVEVKSVSPAQPRPFDSVADQVLSDYRTQETVTRLDALAAQFRESVASGTSFDEAAAALGGEVSGRTLSFGPAPEGIPPGLVEQLFTQNLGDVADAPLPDGESVMVAVAETVTFGPNGQATTFEDRLRLQLGQTMGQELFEAYVFAAQEALGVERNDALIASRFQSEE